MHEPSLQRGTVIGRFTVEELIGAGGMGEVYAARDAQLGRRIALKILPTSRASEPDRVERFLREARAASSLDHPAIVTIFDSGTATPASETTVHYLAMELIDGQSLTQWARSRRNREKLAPLLAQVAEGLARAHAGNIVHRDLKPDNIMVARGGYAKIVDFGVAKLTERNPVNGNSSTDTAPTNILGTASFMSPEQVEGRSVDHRSDVFSFGCVTYAAYQGRSPFERETVVKTMVAVVNDPPPRLAEAPPSIERIARRCVAKDPDERYQSMKDVALDLREAATDQRSARVETRRLWLGAALIASAVFALGSWTATRRAAVDIASAPRETPQMSMVRVTNSGRVGAGTISPDGKYIVYCNIEGDDQRLIVRQIATGTEISIVPPTDGVYLDIHVTPDGNYVLYSFATRAEPNINDVFQIPMLGGEPRKVAADIDGPFTVAPDGRRIAFRRFSAVERIYKIVVADIDKGGERVVLRRQFPYGIGAVPAFSPDGKRLTLTTGNVQSQASFSITDLDLASGRLSRIHAPPWPGTGGMEWLPDGSGMVLTAADRQQPAQLWFLPYPDGAARKITSDVSRYESVSVTAESRSLAVHRSEEFANLWLVDASGKPRPLTTGVGDSFYGANGVCWLRDGTILYTAFVNRNPVMRAIDPKSGETREVVHDGFAPAISPDGKMIAFASYRNGSPDIWLANVDGSNIKQVTNGAVANTPSWFPDNKSLAYISQGEVQGAWKIDLDTQTAVRLASQPAHTPHLSPDGKWLLCRLRSVDGSSPLWRTAILAVDGAAPTRYYDVPRGGGPHYMQWMPDGRSFAFVDLEGGANNIWVQDVRGGRPRQLTHFESGRIYAYDIGRDGRIVVSHGDPANDMVLIRDFR